MSTPSVRVSSFYIYNVVFHIQWVIWLSYWTEYLICLDIQTKLEQSQEDANRIEQQLHEKENILQEQLQQLQDLALEHNNLQNEYSSMFTSLSIQKIIIFKGKDNS